MCMHVENDIPIILNVAALSSIKIDGFDSGFHQCRMENIFVYKNVIQLPILGIVHNHRNGIKIEMKMRK